MKNLFVEIMAIDLNDVSPVKHAIEIANFEIWFDPVLKNIKIR